MESHLQELWPSCVCAVVFLLLLLWDVSKALTRRAHWAPGQALLLSALTIQMLGLIDYSDISYICSKGKRNEQAADILVREDQLLFDCARLMMCVFIGYLLPAMVPRYNWSRVWSDIGALLLSVMARMAFEVYFVWKVTKPFYRIPNRRQSVWFIVSNTTLFTASLLLLLLLSCAVLAGKSIRSTLSGKVQWALSCCCESNSPSPGKCKNSCCSDSDGPCKNWCCSQKPEKCDNIEDHVLKSWIVARVSQPEYIMARSVFSALAGVVVTIAVVMLVVKWTCLHLPLDYGIAHKATISIELAFILIGWMAVSFRWLSAVVFFPRKAEFLFCLEDFWTMSIVELKADLDAQLTRPLYKMKKFSQRREGQKLILNLITAVRLHSILLPMRVWVQMLMVWLSKACWGLSQMLTRMIRPFVMRMLDASEGRQQGIRFKKFSKALEFLRMPGETAYDLWIANKMAFKRTERNMKGGAKKGEGNSAKLMHLIKHKHDELGEDDKYISAIKQMPLKRSVVSLMYCMIHFYEDNVNFDAINAAVVANSISDEMKDDVLKAFNTARVINKARKACSKAWDVLDFVDSSDVGADAEFHNLVSMWHKHYKNVKALKLAMERLQREGNATALKNWHGSKEWMRLTVHCNLYNRLYKKFSSFHENLDEDQGKLPNNLQSRLAYVIHGCLEKQLGKVLIEKCNKWAEEGNEEEIYHASFIAGKAKGLRDKIAEWQRTTANENERRMPHVACVLLVG